MSSAVITGATSGLGKAFVEILLRKPKFFGKKHEIDVFYLVGRNEEKMQALLEEFSAYKNIKFVPLLCDLSIRSEVDKLCSKLLKESPDLSVLINCAGMGKFGDFLAVPLAEHRKILDINVDAVMTLTYALAPIMRDKSRIIQVSSSASFAALPGMATYSASKAFVRFWSVALRKELQKRGIIVTVVCPGAIMTDFFKVANEYDEMQSLSKKYMISGAEEVAYKALKDAKWRKMTSVYTLPIKFMHLLCKIFPQRFVAWVWTKIS